MKICIKLLVSYRYQMWEVFLGLDSERVESSDTEELGYTCTIWLSDEIALLVGQDKIKLMNTCL